MLAEAGEAAAVGAVAVLLASDECPSMTGAEVMIDGGLLAGAATVSDRGDAPG